MRLKVSNSAHGGANSLAAQLSLCFPGLRVKGYVNAVPIPFWENCVYKMGDGLFHSITFQNGIIVKERTANDYVDWVLGQL
jgi:hypothetical protein